MAPLKEVSHVSGPFLERRLRLYMAFANSEDSPDNLEISGGFTAKAKDKNGNMINPTKTVSFNVDGDYHIFTLDEAQQIIDHLMPTNPPPPVLDLIMGIQLCIDKMSEADESQIGIDPTVIDWGWGEDKEEATKH